MVAGTALSPTPSLRRDLSEVTEHLCHAAAWIALHGAGRAVPYFEWSARRVALAPMLAHVHGIGSLLSCATAGFPPHLVAVFARQRAMGSARAELLRGLRDAFVAEARALGARPVALKGARTFDTLYADIGLRPMADLDFLCAPGELDACRAAASRVGLDPLGSTERHAVFGRRDAGIARMLAEHPGNPVKIEVHTRLAEAFFDDAVDVTAETNCLGGPVAHAVYALLHASQHASVRTLRFCQLADLGLMLRDFDGAAWRSLMDALLPLGLWWAFAPLALTASYFPGVVNAAELARARRAAPWLARRATWRISDVSYSAIGDGGLWARLRWARQPARAVGFLARDSHPRPKPMGAADASGLDPAFRVTAGGRTRRVAAWLFGTGIRPVSARLIQLALEAPETPA